VTEMTAVPPPPDTNPNGWDDHSWLSRTWEALQDLKREVARNGKDVRALSVLIRDLDRIVVEGFKRQGIRLREVERRASESQVDAQEARSTAREAESATVRAFVEDAKPFARWKQWLLSGAVGVLFTLITAAICKQCGLTP
jgi:hypothetical protein